MGGKQSAMAVKGGQKGINEPLPPNEEVEKLFDQLLESLALPKSQEKNMRNMDVERKWALVCSQNLNKPKSAMYDDPEVYVRLLSENLSLKTLQFLRIELTHKPVDWIQKFIEVGGLKKIFEVLAILAAKRDTKSDKKMFEYLRGVKALMNVQSGLLAVLMEDTNGLRSIAMCYDSVDIRIKKIVLEILSAIGMLEGGSKLVLDAMNYFMEQTNERFRFQLLMKNLNTAVLHIFDEKMSQQMTEISIYIIRFINSVVNSPEDLLLRVHLRNEFLDLNIEKLLMKLKEANRLFINSNDLNMQMMIFADEYESDKQELAATFLDADMSDPLSMVDAIYKKVQNTETFLWFRKMCQDLMLIPYNNPELAPKYLQLVRSILSQIVLQRPHLDDPDFHLNYQLDVQSVLESLLSTDASMANKEKAGSLEKDLKFQQSTYDAKIEEIKKAARGESSWPSWLGLEKDPGTITSAPQGPVEPALAVVTGGPAPPPPPGGVPPPPPPPGTGPPPPPPPPPPPGGFPGAPPPPPPPPGMGGPPPPPPPPGFGPPGAPVVPVGPPAKRVIKPKYDMKNLNWKKAPPKDIKGSIWESLDDEKWFDKIDEDRLAAALRKKVISTQGKSDICYHYDASSTPPTLMYKIDGTDNWQTFEMSPSKKAGYKAGWWHLNIPMGTGQLKFTIKNIMDDNNGENYKIIEKGMYVIKTMTIVKIEPKVTHNLFNPSRGQNMGIMLHRIQLPYPTIRKAVIELDEGVFDEELLQSFIDNAPIPDEIEQVQNFSGNKEWLGNAEKFVLAVSTISKYKNRLQGLQFKLTFPGRVMALKPDLEIVMKAIQQIRNSEKFKKLLEIILAMGNYMNGGKRSGGAHGLKFDSLLKLGDTKTADNKQTFLHFLDNEIFEFEPEILTFHEKMTDLKAAVRVDLKNVRLEISKLHADMKLVQADLNYFLENSSEEGARSYVESMKPFLEKNSKIPTQLTEALQDTEAQFEKMMKYFLEDPKKCSTDEFFNRFQTFVDQMKQARKDNVARQEKIEADKRKAERAKENQAERERLKKERLEQKNNVTKLSDSTDGSIPTNRTPTNRTPTLQNNGVEKNEKTVEDSRKIDQSKKAEVTSDDIEKGTESFSPGRIRLKSTAKKNKEGDVAKGKSEADKDTADDANGGGGGHAPFREKLKAISPRKRTSNDEEADEQAKRNSMHVYKDIDPKRANKGEKIYDALLPVTRTASTPTIHKLTPENSKSDIERQNSDTSSDDEPPKMFRQRLRRVDRESIDMTRPVFKPSPVIQNKRINTPVGNATGMVLENSSDEEDDDDDDDVEIEPEDVQEIVQDIVDQNGLMDGLLDILRTRRWRPGKKGKKEKHTDSEPVVSEETVNSIADINSKIAEKQNNELTGKGRNRTKSIGSRFTPAFTKKKKKHDDSSSQADESSSHLSHRSHKSEHEDDSMVHIPSSKSNLSKNKHLDGDTDNESSDSGVKKKNRLGVGIRKSMNRKAGSGSDTSLNENKQHVKISDTDSAHDATDELEHDNDQGTTRRSLNKNISKSSDDVHTIAKKDFGKQKSKKKRREDVSMNEESSVHEEEFESDASASSPKTKSKKEKRLSKGGSNFDKWKKKKSKSKTNLTIVTKTDSQDDEKDDTMDPTPARKLRISISASDNIVHEANKYPDCDEEDEEEEEEEMGGGVMAMINRINSNTNVTDTHSSKKK